MKFNVENIKEHVKKIVSEDTGATKENVEIVRAEEIPNSFDVMAMVKQNGKLTHRVFFRVFTNGEITYHLHPVE